MASAKTILHADDEKVDRVWVKHTLEALQHELIQVVDGADALAITASKCPDLVILDWMMPNLDGLNVVRAIRAFPTTQHIPIILLTAHVDESDVDLARSCGIQEYLVKPAAPETLISAVQNLLGEPVPAAAPGRAYEVPATAPSPSVAPRVDPSPLARPGAAALARPRRSGVPLIISIGVAVAAGMIAAAALHPVRTAVTSEQFSVLLFLAVAAGYVLAKLTDLTATGLRRKALAALDEMRRQSVQVTQAEDRVRTLLRATKETKIDIERLAQTAEKSVRIIQEVRGDSVKAEEGLRSAARTLLPHFVYLVRFAGETPGADPEAAFAEIKPHLEALAQLGYQDESERAAYLSLIEEEAVRVPAGAVDGG